jgi:hypothetical protein
VHNAMLMGNPQKNGDQGHSEEGSVDICNEIWFGERVVSKYILSTSASVSSLKFNQHTLAKKLLVVQRNTVTSSKNIPNVLRATFSNPTPARKPVGFNGRDLAEDIERRSRCSSGVSRDMMNSSTMGGGTGGTCALICAARGGVI